MSTEMKKIGNLEDQRLGKGYEEELENDTNGNGNNNRDMLEEMESICQRLQDQYLRGLSLRGYEEKGGKK